MRRSIGVIVLTLLMVGLCITSATCRTYCDDWRMKIRVENSGLSQGILTVGTAPDATDDYDYGFDNGYGQTSSGAAMAVCVDLPGNQYNPSGLWCTDIRRPLTGGGQWKIWNLKACINGMDSGAFTLNAWMSSSGKLTSPDIHLAIYDGAVTYRTFRWSIPLWTCPCYASGSSTAPQYTQTFSYVGGFRSFTVIAYIEPEPCSMAVLVAGLAGVWVIALRRRKL